MISTSCTFSWHSVRSLQLYTRSNWHKRQNNFHEQQQGRWLHSLPCFLDSTLLWHPMPTSWIVCTLGYESHFMIRNTEDHCTDGDHWDNIAKSCNVNIMCQIQFSMKWSVHISSYTNLFPLYISCDVKYGQTNAKTAILFINV